MKAKGILGGRLKSAQHHWWPRSLSSHWAACDGLVTQVDTSEKETRAPPHNFGAIGNAHQIKLSREDNPWNFDFEPVFGPVDADIGNLVSYISTLDAPIRGSGYSSGFKFLSHDISDDIRSRISNFVASMIMRNPYTRHKIRQKVIYFLERFGLENPSVDKSLLAGNTWNNMNFMKENLDSGGVFGVLFSDSNEFIFGDGFMHNLPIGAPAYGGEICILPLIPSASIIYVNLNGYRGSRILAARLENDAVFSFNEIVQIYSKDRIFYRSMRPQISEYFLKGEHLSIDIDRSGFLDSLIQGISGS